MVSDKTCPHDSKAVIDDDDPDLVEIGDLARDTLDHVSDRCFFV